jgi:hypothetical protein
MHRLHPQNPSFTRVNSPLFLCTPYWTPLGAESGHCRPSPAHIKEGVILASLPDHSGAPYKAHQRPFIRSFSTSKTPLLVHEYSQPPTVSFIYISSSSLPDFTRTHRSMDSSEKQPLQLLLAEPSDALEILEMHMASFSDP